jgi:cholesterol transport system auxiliary component
MMTAVMAMTHERRPGPSAAGALAALLLLGSLAGCTDGLLKSDAPVADTYRLAAVPEAAAQPATPLPFAIIVQRPRASVALDTDRIAVVAAGSRFDYYSAAQWAEPAPQMLQQQLVAALVATGQFGGGVFAAPARVPAELLLDVELRRFEAATNGADSANPGASPVAHVQAQFSVIDSRRGTRVTSFVADAAVPATANRLSAVVAAFDQANAQVLRDAGAQVQAAVAALPAP